MSDDDLDIEIQSGSFGPKSTGSIRVELEASGKQFATRSDIKVLKEPVRLGRYTLTGLIGKGGMAEVFLAKQDGPAGFEKTVVVKRIRKALVEEQKFIDMFLREARIAARLNHMNVVQIFELGQEGDEYFIAMEYLDGITLHRAARRSWAMEKSMPMEVVLRCVADAAQGLHHAHTLREANGNLAPLVHRDISPDNLLLTRDGITKVLDFGIAKDHRASELQTMTGEIKGKVPFMSPEQIRGDGLDGRSDLWSLGVTTYWLLTGRRPFDGGSDHMTIDHILRQEPTPLRDINPLVPAEVQTLVLGLLDKDPNGRTSSGAELHDTLVHMLGPAGGTNTTSNFANEMLAAPQVESERNAGSVVTVAAARPVTAWLKKLGDGSQIHLENMLPEPTPTSGQRMFIPDGADADAGGPTTTTGELIAAATGKSGSRAPLAAGIGIVAAILLGAVGFALIGGPDEPAETVASTGQPPQEELATNAPDDAPPSKESEAAPSPDEAAASAAAAAEQPAEEPTQEAAPGEDAPEEAAAADGPEATTPPAETAKVTKRTPRAAPTNAVRVKAPRSVTWRTPGGKKLGKGSGTLRVPVGTDTIVGTNASDSGRVVVPVAGKTSVNWASLASGRLSFRVRPWADVYVGRKKLGTTPLDPVSLPAGTYKVRLKMDDKSVTETVVIPAGGHKIVKKNMRSL
jgi:serine/threonine-protein kinase